MPLGFERLNERTQRPNALINFIRPLPGATAEIAESILNRVAAICYPFMKSNMILVQALEEFPYNTEFVGRNFNSGEVIQLVLKDRHGRWLPQRMIEMVMVHELAHCKQMNHSKAFWRVRDAYAVDLRALWAKGYTGEGMWGRGRNLATGAVQQENVDPGDIPEHLCGGTYGRRSKKRRRGGKAKETLSYAERKQRRILKKFGAGGQALGADDDTKVKLEGGAAKKSKPRVAGSARGRELRAAAALARFETAKEEHVEVKKEETPSDSETENEYEIGDEEAAIDIDGKKMIDEDGGALIKICESEDKDGNSQREMDEIMSQRQFAPRKTASDRPVQSKPADPSPSRSSIRITHLNDIYKRRPSPAPEPRASHASMICVVCSLANKPDSMTCMACSNVLNPRLVADHWKCSSATCKDIKYVNSGDVGRCGICAAPREKG